MIFNYFFLIPILRLFSDIDTETFITRPNFLISIPRLFSETKFSDTDTETTPHSAAKLLTDPMQHKCMPNKEEQSGNREYIFVRYLHLVYNASYSVTQVCTFVTSLKF